MAVSTLRVAAIVLLGVLLVVDAKRKDSPAKPALAVAQVPAQVLEVTSTLAPATTTKKPRVRACTCLDGLCSCCSGGLFGIFQQRGCMNVTYDPDEFSFDIKMTLNNRVLYQNVVSGKHPRPVCIPMPRFPAAKFCVRFSNVYFPGRNVHACVALEGRWGSSTLAKVSFDCFRMGVDGVHVVKPEDGGGLPVVSGQQEEEEEEEDEDEDEDEDGDDIDEEGDEDADEDEVVGDYIESIADEVIDEEDDDDEDEEDGGSYVPQVPVRPPIEEVVVSSTTQPPVKKPSKGKPTPGKPTPGKPVATVAASTKKPRTSTTTAKPVKARSTTTTPSPTIVDYVLVGQVIGHEPI